MIRLYFALAATAILGLAVGWWHHATILKGRAEEKAAELAREQRQHAKDVETGKGVVDGLNKDLENLAKLTGAPAPPPRVVLRYVSATCEPAARTPEPSEPGRAAAGGVPSVRESDRSGPDPLASLRQLAEGAEVVAAYQRACVDWARKVGR
jgi:hypothetical protein